MSPNQSYLEPDRLKRVMTGKKFSDYLKKALEAHFGRDKKKNVLSYKANRKTV